MQQLPAPRCGTSIPLAELATVLLSRAHESVCLTFVVPEYVSGVYWVPSTDLRCDASTSDVMHRPQTWCLFYLLPYCLNDKPHMVVGLSFKQDNCIGLSFKQDNCIGLSFKQDNCILSPQSVFSNVHSPFAPTSTVRLLQRELALVTQSFFVTKDL